MDAEVRRAQTERDFLCETYETDRKLGAAGAITMRQVDMSKKACDAATAALSAARAGSREVGATRSKSTEQAPFDGLVLQWLVEPGQNVMPGMPLLLLGNRDLEVRVQVAQRDLERGVHAGIPAMVRSGGEVHRLQVSGVGPMATGPGRTFEVILPLPAELKMAPAHGTSMRVDFLVAEAANSIAIPEKALAKVNGADIVFVIDDERARAVKVAPGIRDRGLIEIQGDVAVGAWVAVSNLDLLQNGLHVFAVHSANDAGVEP
jgi:RND family efflux transporter MFP subunit